MAFLVLTLLLLAFAALAVIDGLYLHILKYQLFNHTESKFEHITHTIRSILFPLIVYFLFISQNCNFSFYLGLLFVAIDITVLTIDGYVEKDSRRYMGGLPRWEYILHLFVNGFHFASIAVFLVIKIATTDRGIEVIPDLSALENYGLFRFVAVNLIPGSVVLALIHILTSINSTKSYWNSLTSKIKCCW